MYPRARSQPCAVSYLFASPHYAGTDDDDSLFGAEHNLTEREAMSAFHDAIKAVITEHINNAAKLAGGDDPTESWDDEFQVGVYTVSLNFDIEQTE